jgi:predicted HicB family RNase H-like nuclease
MKGPRKSFALRLPTSIHEQAEKCADLDGTSLNQFITQAVSEKLIRMESQAAQNIEDSDT